MPPARSSARLAKKRRIDYTSTCEDEDKDEGGQQPGSRGDDHASVGQSSIESYSDMDAIQGIETNISRVKSTFRKLHEEIASLRRMNDTLRGKLERRRETGDVSPQGKQGKRAANSNESPDAAVKCLQDEVAQLKEVHKRDKRKIDKLQWREIKRDADELQAEQADQDVGDSSHAMRKLLRRLYDIATVPALGESETCPICIEDLKIKQCLSFPCAHFICNSCFTQLPNVEEDQADCPMCRKRHPREECETVCYTATQQWDEITRIAIEGSQMDHRGEMDTSEEEAEEEFINDESSTASLAVSEVLEDSATGKDSLENAEPAQPAATPPPYQPSLVPGGDTTSPSFRDLPSPMKRKRIQQLADLRASRRR